MSVSLFSIVSVLFCCACPVVVVWVWVVCSKRLPLRQPCAQCGQKAIYILYDDEWSGMMWDGVNAEGEPSGGVYQRAQCKHCGARYETLQREWEHVEEFDSFG